MTSPLRSADGQNDDEIQSVRLSQGKQHEPSQILYEEESEQKDVTNKQLDMFTVYKDDEAKNDDKVRISVKNKSIVTL